MNHQVADAVPAPAEGSEAFERRLKHDVVGAFEDLRALGPIARCTVPLMGTFDVVHRREDVKAMLDSDGDTFLLSPLLGPFAPYFGTRSVMCLDGDAHLARRRLVLPAFHGAALPQMEAQIAELAREVLPGWIGDEPKAVLPHAQELTFMAILRVAFGIHDARRARTASAQLRAHFIAAGRGEVRDQRPVEGLLQGLIDERRASGVERDDLLGMLLGARDEDGAALDDATLRDELLTTLTAGHETTATAISWAAVLLARRPDVVDELRAGRPGLLDSVITEVLRLRPPLWAVGRLAARDTQLAGRTVPRGTQVIVSTLLVQLDPQRYEAPHDFRPERFLDARPAKVDWLPFGAGRHRCAGAAFAQLELRVVLATLLHLVDLEPVGTMPTAALIVNTHVPRDGGMLRLTAGE